MLGCASKLTSLHSPRCMMWLLWVDAHYKTLVTGRFIYTCNISEIFIWLWLCLKVLFVAFYHQLQYDSLKPSWLCLNVAKTCSWICFKSCDPIITDGYLVWKQFVFLPTDILVCWYHRPVLAYCRYNEISMYVLRYVLILKLFLRPAKMLGIVI